MKLVGIPYLKLSGHFVHSADYDKENEDLHYYWRDLNLLCRDSLTDQIKTFYSYNSIISLVDGFPDIKEYLYHTLIKNCVLWSQFTSICENAAKKVSRPERKAELETEIIGKAKPSDEEIKHILEYIEEVGNSLEEMYNWSKNLHEYSKTDIELLKFALQKIGVI